MTIRACWVDANNDADLTKLRAHGIDSAYYDARDTRITAAYLQTVASSGLKPGLYWAWNWYPLLDGPGFAQHVSDDLHRINWPGNPPVILDIETHDVAGYILPCLRRWRALRPTRQTIFTLEGMQGGLFDAPTVQEINRLNVWVAPQLYVGLMEPHPHSPVIDLLMAGLRGDRICGLYDAAHLPYRWSGVAYSQGRLP